MNMHNLPALPRKVQDILDEYERKQSAIPEAVEAFTQATTALESAACMSGAYGGSIWRGNRYTSAPSVAENDLQDILRISAWNRVYKHLLIDRVAPATDRKQFELAMTNPPEFTEGNVLATFGKYIADPLHHILRSLAEVFCDLDPAYKSHSKVKIGVEGLPKRIILSSVGSYGTLGYDRLRDIFNVLNVCRGKPHIEHKELQALIDDADEHGASYHDGIELRTFQNGNGHVIFDPETLREINLALAEFYGDTLPDSPEDVARKRPGTDVSKNLAYYPTPPEVIDRILNSIHMREDSPAILEPSCGCGRIMDAINRKWRGARVTGVEYDVDRADEARAKGHHVHRANFLNTAPNPIFDYVFMNPPFNGTHWKKHLDHARKFLKPSGTVVCILPASACYDGHLAEYGIKPERGTAWKDLPIASFAASGTNIPTGYVILGAGT